MGDVPASYYGTEARARFEQMNADIWKIEAQAKALGFDELRRSLYRARIELGNEEQRYRREYAASAADGSGVALDAPPRVNPDVVRVLKEWSTAKDWPAAYSTPHMQDTLRGLVAELEANAGVDTSQAQSGDNCVSMDRGALQMALNVLRRAGKDEVADALAAGVALDRNKQQENTR